MGTIIYVIMIIFAVHYIKNVITGEETSSFSMLAGQAVIGSIIVDIGSRTLRMLARLFFG